MDKNNNDKHLKYKRFYKQNTLYWGIGIENEMYLEFQKQKQINKKYILNHKKKERYSIDYFSNYKSDTGLNDYIENLETEHLRVPILLNSHSFINTDMYNNPKTMYTRSNENNKNYTGMSLIETLETDNNYFKNNEKWVFDGDTIEIVTVNFFNNTLYKILDELKRNKSEFITNINESFKRLGIFKQYGPLSFMKTNHPFANYLTNENNINMFNNGTLHYNLTLPTKLNENKHIQNIEKFVKDHSKAIRIIQWMEPFLIAVYGSPDPLGYSKASQRCAVSRYISIGTYDSDTMKIGKLLKIKPDILSNLDYWWYNKIDGYNKLDEIGLDINFNKHYNHGIELRFFDHLDPLKIKQSFKFVIFLMDIILESDDILDFDNPIFNKTWNQFVVNIMNHGKSYVLNKHEKEIYQKIFGLILRKNTVEGIYNELYKKFKRKRNGAFSKFVLKKKSFFQRFVLGMK